MHGEEYGGRREGTHKKNLLRVKYGGRRKGTHKSNLLAGLSTEDGRKKLTG